MNTEELRQRLTLIVAETPVNQCWTLSTVHLLKLVEDAVEAEREACAKVVEADGLARGNEGLVLIKAASRIRARGE